MKLKDTKKRSPKLKYVILIAIGVILLSAGGVLAWNYLQPKSQDSSSNKDSTGIEYGPTTDDQQQAGYDIKEQSQTKTDTPKAGDPISLSITAPSPAVVDGSTAHIRLRIDMVTSTGTCTITMIKGSTTISKEVNVQQSGPTSSTCQGFDITDLTPGDWKTTIKVISGDREGSVTETITVQ